MYDSHSFAFIYYGIIHLKLYITTIDCNRLPGITQTYVKK